MQVRRMVTVDRP